ncbi:MAG: ABC transporter substrate-binding protein [Phycisphaerales bacterium]
MVSLLPSATDMMHLLGATHMLVGRSHECDAPGTSGVPVLTGQRIHASSPGEIDRAVREQMNGGGSLYTLDEARLAELAPDVILTQSLCDVCSIDLRTVERVAKQLPGPPRVVDLSPQTVEDILDDVLKVGSAIGQADRALAEVVRLRERLFTAGEFVNPFDDGPVVGFLEWTEPLFCAGHWNVQLIERAGGRHPFNPGVPTPTSGAAAGPMQAERRAGKSIVVRPEILMAAQPEALVIAPCGVGLQAGLAMARELAKQPWWGQLPAVQRGRVAVVDGNLYFSRPSQRVVDAFEWLVGWLQNRDELIPPGFEWVPFEG